MAECASLTKKGKTSKINTSFLSKIVYFLFKILKKILIITKNRNFHGKNTTSLFQKLLGQNIEKSRLILRKLNVETIRKIIG